MRDEDKIIVERRRQGSNMLFVHLGPLDKLSSWIVLHCTTFGTTCLGRVQQKHGILSVLDELSCSKVRPLPLDALLGVCWVEPRGVDYSLGNCSMQHICSLQHEAELAVVLYWLVGQFSRAPPTLFVLRVSYLSPFMLLWILLVLPLHHGLSSAHVPPSSLPLSITLFSP